jgi:predicted DsbA family dithiol-disulfide isomerase
MEQGVPHEVIEVFADVACPFTHVGLRRFVDHRAQAGRLDVRLRVRAWPLEIVNGHPLDPVMIEEEAQALRAAVAPDLFSGFHPDAFPSTSLPAMALAAAGYRRDVSIGKAVSLTLRTLLFERGRDISDPAVLAAVEQQFEVHAEPGDDESVLLDHREGEARGVVGSPHFFTPDGAFFCPALDISRDAGGHLRIVPDDAGFDRFLAACFG